MAKQRNKSDGVLVMGAYPGTNPGMFSVDLTLRQLAGDTPLRHGVLERSVQKLEGLLSYERIDEAAELEKEKVLYWGDFLHNLNWARTYLAGQVKVIGENENGLERWYRAYLLEGVAAPAKAMSFGTTLLTLSSRDLADTRYRAAIGGLASKLGRIGFRDAISVSLARARLGFDAHQDCDAAFLLDTAALLKNLDTAAGKFPRPRSYLLLVLGRSGLAEEQLALVKAMAQQLKLPLLRLTWFEKDESLRGFLVKLWLIRNARFVYTDVYHVLVSALRESVPTLCALKGTASAWGALDDEKKRVLCLQLGLREQMLFTEEVFLAAHHPDRVRTLAREACERLSAVDVAAELESFRASVVAPRRKELVEFLRG